MPSRRAAYLLALMQIPRVGVWTAIRVSRAFPDPRTWLEASPEYLNEVLGTRFATPLVNANRADWPALAEQAEAQVARHRESGIAVVAIDEPGYPPLMALSAAPAAVLYVRGTPRVLDEPNAVAVIGTRQPTPRGLDVARRLATFLVESQFTVVSGLAKGIDREAHEAALDAGGRTIALLGTAIDKVYPAQHRPLAARIEAEGGALVSEYPVGSADSARQFVERDRLQAGMSIAVVPVQTGLQGGTLHTVRFAQEAGRLVVVPRPLPDEADDPAYGGIQALIRSEAVSVIDSAADYPALFTRLREWRDHLLGRSEPALGPSPADEQGRLGL